MSSIACGATFGMFAVCWLPAQAPPPVVSLRLVVGDRVLEMPAGREVAVLAGQHNAPPAVWIGGDRYVRGEVAVDALTGESLEQERSTLSLYDAAHRRSWAVKDVAFAGALPQSRVLLPDRVVVAAHGGGVVALGRGDGGVLWRRADAPARLLVGDGDLIFAAGFVGEELAFAGLAIGNGARAFTVALTSEPRAIVPAAHGVAVVGAARVLVHDRSGPELFALDVAADEVVAGALWFVRAGEVLLAFDRRGEQVWRRPIEAGEFGRTRLAVTEGGDLLVLRYDDISDSGFAITCCDSAGGAVLWRHEEAGVLVGHSKYRHLAEARAIGRSVFVTSQGSAGAFVVELDAGDGRRRARREVGG